MKEVDRKKVSKNNQRKFSAKSETRDHNLQVKSGRKALKAEETEVKASSAKADSGILVSESNTGTEPSEVCENMEIDYVDDVCRSEEAPSDLKSLQNVEKDTKANHPDDVENEPKEAVEEESDDDTDNDSVSSQGDVVITDDEKVERVSRVPKTPAKTDLSGGCSQSERVKTDQRMNSKQAKASNSTPKKPIKPNKEPSKLAGKNISEDLKNMKVHPKLSSDSSEEVVDKAVEETKDADNQDETSVSANSVGSDDEPVNADINCENEDNAAAVQKIQEMESRIEKLEEELREVAALEVALYSVVPEHGSSAHKVHTPARRLCRLYIHACKHWSPNKRGTVARNTVSGLVLIAKSCGHDVPRLTFWLSNVVVLREIVSQTFGSSCQSSSLTRIFESNGGGKNSEARSSLKWKSNSGSKQSNKQGFVQLVDDWQETRTFIVALESVESWIFSRMVESIWWQTLTPNMQSPHDEHANNQVLGRILGPPLGDQQQGSFAINLWKNAFQDAFRRLCPVRAGGHECGCLPVLARKVMEQCLARLDVAMFNAILRESEHEIPTDPVSDPIVDSKVLPIPAGDLSFGSGAQLKNSVGNWSRWLSDLFGMKDDQKSSEEDGEGVGDEPKCFNLLSTLSDLLMLPKDMLMDRTIRMEVCPQISLPLVKRILCNFTPDEFCPDPVPGAVLEALNAECIIERRLSGDSAGSFPYPAAPVIYTSPFSAEVAEKVSEAGGKSQLSRSASAIQRKGYTSDEDLVELDSPLESIVDKSPSSPTKQANGFGNQKQEETGYVGANARYELLREVWMAT
ncbi:hypothetical protein ACH5RR_007382 [Cinchona calisaya]|uniref:Dilute domain-containing protein n=1 Tax=Cinchona calisaya TaxID=153742 RepID=A0ABD3ARS0_9GENT